MDRRSTWLLLFSLLGTLLIAGGVELTFELADNAKECFYQEIEKNVSSTLEFQVGDPAQYRSTSSRALPTVLSSSAWLPIKFANVSRE